MSASQSTVLSDTRPAFRVVRERIVKFIARRRVALSIVLFAAIALYALRSGYRPHDPFDYRDPLGVSGTLLVICGLAVRTWAAGILQKDSELTTSGPYRVIRNPLYAGSFLMMVGFCMLIANPIASLIVAASMAMIYSIAVRGEERFLSRRFAEQWAGYSRATPRFIPGFSRVDIAAPWRIRQWLHHREYQAVTTSMAALLLLKICR